MLSVENIGGSLKMKVHLAMKINKIRRLLLVDHAKKQSLIKHSVKSVDLNLETNRMVKIQSLNRRRNVQPATRRYKKNGVHAHFVKRASKRINQILRKRVRRMVM
jgi:hypothetical protein